jgi:hypothetical protein
VIQVVGCCGNHQPLRPAARGETSTAVVFAAAIAADYRFPQNVVIDHAVAGAGASGPGASRDEPIPPAAHGVGG